MSYRALRWLPIQLAPEDCDLEVGELDKTGIMPLGFPCRRKLGLYNAAWADEPILIVRRTGGSGAPTSWQADFCGRAPFLKKWNHVMRTALCFAMLLIPTIALAQGATPAKRPTVSAKPFVQTKPRAPVGCKLVGTVKGTKLWAGECTATPDLRTGTPAEESSPTSVPDATGGATPKDQQ
jgi:hypothetical protein